MAQKALETLEHVRACRYKEARKAITAALDKRKDNAQYVALRALLLIRTGVAEEGVELMRNLKSKNVDDAFVTEVIIECLHETGASAEALDVMEAQFNMNPQRGSPREDMLLASYVRAGCFSKLQQYCMRAFRESGNSQYYIWSLVANAQHATTPSGARLADLACKQLLKAGDEGKFSSAEHVIFFLDFLCAINQPQRVLDAVQRPWVVAAFRRDEERLRFQGDALLKLQAYAAAQEVHERLLQVDADEWTFLQALLQCRCASQHLPLVQVHRSLCVDICTSAPSHSSSPSSFLQLPDASTEPSAHARAAVVLSSESTAAASSIAQTFKAIDDAHEAKGMHRRGALLAQIHLYTSLVCSADPSSDAAAVADAADTSLLLIQQFITRFSSLSSCALDLAPFLMRLTPQLLEQLLQQLLLLPPHARALTEDLHSLDSSSQLARRCASVCSVNRITVMAESLLHPSGPFEFSMPRILQVLPSPATHVRHHGV
jgi:tetratricopeptide (TPR) repeat protein